MSNLQLQNQRRTIIELNELNRQIPFNPQKQFYPADLFILIGFDSRDQPIKERNPRWHLPKTDFTLGGPTDDTIQSH